MTRKKADTRNEELDHIITVIELVCKMLLALISILKGMK